MVTFWYLKLWSCLSYLLQAPQSCRQVRFFTDLESDKDGAAQLTLEKINLSITIFQKKNLGFNSSQLHPIFAHMRPTHSEQDPGKGKHLCCFPEHAPRRFSRLLSTHIGPCDEAFLFSDSLEFPSIVQAGRREEGGERIASRLESAGPVGCVN